MPEISVIMPVYNAENFINEAIQSILNQTFINFELIVIDDGSSDNSLRIIDSFNDKRIIRLTNPVNSGIIETLNRGLETAKGFYIARMDADDIALSYRLQKQIEYMHNHPEIDVLDSCIEEISEDGLPIEHKPTSNNYQSDKQIKKRLPAANCLNHPSVIAKAKIFKKYSYSPNAKHVEDYLLWLSLAAKGYTFAKHPEVLLKRRINLAGITQNSNKRPHDVLKKLLRAYRLFFQFAATEKIFSGFVLRCTLWYGVYSMLYVANKLFPFLVPFYLKTRDKLPKFLYFKQ